MNSMVNIFKKEKLLGAQVNWDDVYRECLPRVYNFFRYRVGDDALAEDLTALTFEKAWRARETFRQDAGAVTAWLFAIARNAATDHFRADRSEVQLDAVTEVGSHFSVEENFQREDDSRRLEFLLAKLNVRDRELLAIKYGGGLTNREIARVTGLSESNVGTILNRIVSRLRVEWEKNHER